MGFYSKTKETHLLGDRFCFVEQAGKQSVKGVRKTETPNIPVKTHGQRTSGIPCLSRPSQPSLSLALSLLLSLLLLPSAILLPGCGTRTRAPAGARSVATQKAEPDGRQRPSAMVVGTIHRHHLTQAGYPLQLLGALLDRYNPDLVLVEIRPEPFAQGRLEDGPFEMTYVTYLARQRGIPVEPIDWWRKRTVIADEPQPADEDRVAYQATMKELMTRYRFPPDFQESHARERTELLFAGLSARARFLGGNAAWNQRQSWFHNKAEAAIAKHEPRRVLAFVGNNHRPELALHLDRLGFDLECPLSLPLPPLKKLRSETIPEGVVSAWLEGAKRLGDKAESFKGRQGGPAFAAGLEAKRHYFLAAAKHGGRCCLPPERLDINPPDPPRLKPATPEEVGIAPDALARLVARAEASGSDALIVLKNGKLVVENYFGKDQAPIELMSVTKSIAGLAIGKLISLGVIPSVDQPVHHYHPEWRQGQKREITLRHLMNHTSGLQTHPRANQEIYPAPDFVRLALTAELSSAPGEVFLYNNKAVALLASIVAKAAGEPLDRFVERTIFRPLAITDYRWLRDRAGNPHVLAGLSLRAIDLARIGQMLLDQGRAGGQQILNAEWVKDATRRPCGQVAACGLLWWLHHAWRKSTLDDELIARWREAGATPAMLSAAEKLKGKVLDHPVYRKTLLKLLGKATTVKLDAMNVPIRSVVTGPLVAFNANGWLGQYLVVVPEHRIVAVRLMRAPPDAGTATFEEKKVDDMKDFQNLVIDLVPNPAPSK